jgi:predicted exporter
MDKRANLFKPLIKRLGWPVLLWLVLLVLAAGLTARARYVADLSAFLPAAPTPEQRVLLDQLRSGATSRLLLIGLRGPEAAAGSAQADAAQAQRVRLSLALGQALRASGSFEAVHNGDSSAFKATGEFLFAHRYLLSPAVRPERFTAEGLRAAIDDTLGLLGTPAGALVKPLLWRDPTGEAVQMAQTMTPVGAPQTEGGVWVSRQPPRAVLLASTRADGADLDGQAAAMVLVQHTLDRLLDEAAVAPAARPVLELSGPGVMGVQSRQLIQQEAWPCWARW